MTSNFMLITDGILFVTLISLSYHTHTAKPSLESTYAQANMYLTVSHNARMAKFIYPLLYNNKI